MTNGVPPTRASDIDIRPSLNLVLLCLLLCVLALNVVMERIVGVSAMMVITLAVFASTGAAWLLGRLHGALSRWFLVLALLALLAAASIGAGMHELLVLTVLPIALAAALLDLRSAVVVCGIATAVLLALGRQVFPQHALPVSLYVLTSWGMLGIMALVYGAIYNLAHWSWAHYTMALHLLDDERDRKAQLAEALSELAHANQQLALMNERLAVARQVAEAAEKTKASFVANVSHEFRTPLNIIIGVVDLLVETPQIYGRALPDPLLADLDIVRRNCDHLSSMINDVLDLSQIEAGRLALHRERVRLDDLIERSLPVVRPLIQKKNLSLRVHVAESLPEVYCDLTRVRQVILNLLSNAARYTDAGEITLCAEQQGQFVQVSVQDTGPGIGADDAKHIFEAFYQGSTGQSVQQRGSGLGLSISREFVEMHGGAMTLESTPGQGSTFTFTLPISPLLEPTPPAHSWLRQDWPWLDRSGKKGIEVPPADPPLMIFDVTGELSPLLTRYAGEVPVQTVSALEEAGRRNSAAAHAALVINAASAAQACALTEEARLAVPGTPIIGCALPQRTQHARAAGAEGYLLKPVSRTTLQAVLDRSPAPARVLVVDDELDTQQLMRRTLSACKPGIHVGTAGSGEEALHHMRTLAPDLVLLDILLPDMDGWQVLERKAADAHIRDIPTVMLSAQDPHDRPVTSPLIVAAMDDGLSVSKLLTCVRMLATVLPRAD